MLKWIVGAIAAIGAGWIGVRLLGHKKGQTQQEAQPAGSVAST